MAGNVALAVIPVCCELGSTFLVQCITVHTWY